jgi:hypothetical protein
VWRFSKPCAVLSSSLHFHHECILLPSFYPWFFFLLLNVKPHVFRSLSLTCLLFHCFLSPFLTFVPSFSSLVYASTHKMEGTGMSRMFIFVYRWLYDVISWDHIAFTPNIGACVPDCLASHFGRQ